MKRTNIGTSVTKTFRRFSGKTFISWLRWMKCIRVYLLSKIIESSSKDLPQIYQPFTKDLPKIRNYLAFYFLNIYQGFTTNLPMIYQRFTKSTKHLPTAYQQLTKIFFQFTKDLPQIYQHIFGVKYFLIFRK